MLGRAAQPDAPRVLRHGARGAGSGGVQFARQITPGDRILRPHDARRRIETDDFAAAGARSRTDVEQAVGRKHDLRVVFDHDQRVAGIAQLVHHADDAAHVARMQADRRFVEHEQRVHQGRAERGCEIDPLHFAAGQRARLPVQRQITQAHLVQVVEPRADLADQHVGGFIERPRQFQRIEQQFGAFQRQQHDVVQGQARQCGELRVTAGHTLGLEARPLAQRRIGIFSGAHAPQQRIGLQPCAAAGRAFRVSAVLGQQHAHMHLVGLGFEPLEKPRCAVPYARP